MAKLLFVVNGSPYGTERAYNALRLAIAVLKKDSATELRMFLVGDGASCAKVGQVVAQGYYNVEIMLKGIAKRGGVIGVCGTCMDARALKDVELVEGTHRSSLDEWAAWALWADKTLVF